MLWAYQNGITRGLSDGSFGIGRACTRAEVVVFLYACCGPKG